jgi:tRNA (guanine26-N2/guanine27-N2)-dimethyltransferase
MGGPIWSEAIHDKQFVELMLEEIKKGEKEFHTHTRMLGMATVISEELADSPLYFVLPEVSKRVKCITPPMVPMRSAILNAGYRVSGSHCNTNALKTNAPPRFLWDVMRAWVLSHPSLPFFFPLFWHPSNLPLHQTGREEPGEAEPPSRGKRCQGPPRQDPKDAPGELCRAPRG